MSLSKLFETSFDEILSFGSHTKKVKLAKDLTVTLIPLTEDKLIAVKLAIPQAAKTDVLTYQAVESFEILARSIIAINGISIIDAAEEEAKEVEGVKAEDLAIKTTRKYLGKLSPKMLNYMSKEYNELVREQYESLKGGIGEDIENF